MCSDNGELDKQGWSWSNYRRTHRRILPLYDFRKSKSISNGAVHSQAAAKLHVRDGRIWQIGDKKTGLFAVQAGGNLSGICTATMALPRPAFPLPKNTACFAKGRFLANRLPRI